MANWKKTEIRVASCSDVASQIDRGFEIDQLLKNLDVEGKAIKPMVAKAGQKKMKEDEISIRLEGEKKANALVTVAESLNFDEATPKAADFKKAVDEGKLGEAVEKSVTVTLKPNVLDEIKKLIGDVKFAEMTVTSTSYSINASKVREMEKSVLPEVKALGVLVREVSARSEVVKVKYEGKDSKK